MEIDLKNKLRALRRQKNITQEDLANHLDITSQSVGKWERGEGYPDITLLPKIALYFGITVDELLNVYKARIEERYNAYLEESRQYGFDGETAKDLELWEKAYKEFPNDCRVMSKLMFAIWSDTVGVMPEDRMKQTIELGEKILSKSTDNKLREDAIICICNAYRGNDDEKALQYADMAGDFIGNRVDLRCNILSGEEGVAAIQEYVRDLILVAAQEASAMPHKKRLSYEEMIEAYSFAIDIMKRLYSDGNL
ncbi:MAG: helix-turn-helix transcriptional regulator, partial [Lachnospiraceae bacterium]|nr:helix-turn-helix transcriptional regulator [Lachnospiraceae bacterium]